MVMLSVTDEEMKKLESQKWVVDDDDTWWLDLVCCDLKQDWIVDEFIKSIQQDLNENLSIDEIYEKYEKIKSI